MELDERLNAAYGDKIQVETETSKSLRPGQFDVVVSGKTIWSKWEKGRFPSFEEIKPEIDKTVLRND